MSRRLVCLPDLGRGGVQEIGRVLFAGPEGSADQEGSSLRGGLGQLLAARRDATKYDARHALTWKTGLAATAPQRPLSWLLWAHGAELTRDRGPWTVFRKRMLQSCTLLCSTPTAARQLDIAGYPSILVGPPIATSSVQIVAPPSDGVLKVASVGRMVERKGHDRAIDAVDNLRAQGVDCELDIIGAGPDERRLSELARDRPHVRLHVDVPNLDRDKILANAHALLFLPRSEGEEHEGLGMVTLEAASLGVPSVVTLCGGSGDAVVDGVTGHLLETAESPKAVAAAVLDVVTHRSRMSRSALASSRHFSLENWWKRVLAAEQGNVEDWSWPS